MSDDEKTEIQRQCRERWQRWLDEQSWLRGQMPTWKPVMTEQQKRGHERYVAEHNLPF